MASRREVLAAAIVAALEVDEIGNTYRPGRLTVHRNRNRPIQSDQLPALVVSFGVEGVEYEVTDKADRRLRFWVEARTKVPPGAGPSVELSPDAVLDPLLTWIVKALENDFTLEGRAIDLREIGTSWAQEIETEDLAAAAVEFEAVYQTAYNDPERI